MADTEIVESYSQNFESWINDFGEWQTAGLVSIHHGSAITDSTSNLIGIPQEVK